jgi:peptidoglycan/LPS O-acetylase OafA/YrhL
MLLAGSAPAIAPLTSLRWFLAWWVCIYHLTIPEVAPLPAGWLEPLRAHGYLAVDGFFVLSGFILAHVYRSQFQRFDQRTYARFLVARLARVYPAHLATLLAMLLMLLAATQLAGLSPRVAERFSAREFLLHLSLLHAWGLSSQLAWNFPSWSISAEWFAYLCFPLVHMLVLRARGPGRPLAVIAAGLAGLAALEGFGPHGGGLSYTFEFALVRIGCEFSIGAALLMLAQPWMAGWTSPDRGRPRPHGLVGLAAALAGPFLLPDTLSVGLLALLILLLSHPDDLLGRALDRRWLIYGGETSYAVYMVHGLFQWLAIQAVRTVGPIQAAPGWLRLAVLVLIVHVAAMVLYRLVEVPMRAWVRTQGERHVVSRLPAGSLPA